MLHDGGVTGQLSMATESELPNATLDEPVSATLLRDLRAILFKLKVVLSPRTSRDDAVAELRNWDLWGPLLLCTTLSVMLSLSAPVGQSSLTFAAVFVVVWCGAAVVTVNAQLLGGKVSFFQSVCVLGYCIFPMNITAVLCALWGNTVWKAIVVSLGFVWATRASVVFMSQLVSEERRLLAAFPVFLFYLVIAWMIFISSG